MRSLLRAGEVFIDDEKTGYERDDTGIGADPCGQRSDLSIPIGPRIVVKNPNGYPDGQNRQSIWEFRLTHREGISEIRSRARLSFRPVTDLDRQRLR